MKKAFLAFAALAAGVAAQAQDSGYKITVDFPYVSKYVFRGVELADESIQPSIEVAVGDFYVGVWTNNPLVKNFDNEVDFYAGYGIPLSDTWKIDLGATYYAYFETDDSILEDQIEPFVGLTGTIGGVSTSVYAYYELEYDIFTGVGSLGYSLPLAESGLSLDFTGTLGWVSPDVGEDYVYYGVGVAIPYKLNDNATVRVGLDWVDNDIDNGDDTVWFTAGLSLGF